MLVLGALLVPVGGILLARFFVIGAGVDVDALYDRSGPYAHWRAAVPGLLAWSAGAAVYSLSGPIGGTLPSLATAALTYFALGRAHIASP